MPAFTPDPTTVVRTSQKLWSEVVAEADARSGDSIKPPYDPAYQFNNGRKFEERNHYSTDPPQR